MPANQTLSVYCPKDLWDAIQAAENDPSINFKATEFCKQKLTELFSGSEPVPAVPSSLVERPDGTSIATHDFSESAAPIDQYDYEITFQDTVTSASAFLNDVVQPQGGYPIAMMTDATGRLGFLIGWPKQQG